jgi:PncC family amidohydrolase
VKEGKVTVNYETVLKPRFEVKVGDEIRFEDKHIKIEANRDIKRKQQPKPEKHGVRHGKANKWESKPLKPQLKLEQKVENAAWQLHKKLQFKNLTIAIAESCTGGMIQSYITANSGASKYFMGGVIAYSNRAKQKILQIPQDTLEKYGAVSKETAIQMATSTRQIFQCDIAASVTGIAGPSGGTKEKPVGTVYIAAANKEKKIHKKLQLRGNRTKIRQLATLELLKFIWENF